MSSTIGALKLARIGAGHWNREFFSPPPQKLASIVQAEVHSKQEQPFFHNEGFAVL
jgi:hypothetical protein